MDDIPAILRGTHYFGTRKTLITFKKYGHKGIYRETRRQPHPGQSEWREYSDLVGDWSAVIRVNVGQRPAQFGKLVGMRARHAAPSVIP